jgi:chromosome partitioning protein
VLTEGKAVDDCIYEIQPNLYFVPGSTDMKFFDSEDEGILKRALDTPFLNNTIDIVLIDNPPAINNKTFNSFVASTHVLIVTEAEDFSVSGLQQLEDNIRDIKASNNNSLEIVGIVINKVDKRRKLNRQYQAYIKTHYNGLVFESSISNYSEIPRSIYEGKPVSDCYPKSKSCVQFDNVSNELTKRLGCEVKYGNARP